MSDQFNNDVLCGVIFENGECSPIYCNQVTGECYSPLITKYCNSGQLDTIVPYIIQRDPRVIEFNADLKECTQFLLSLQEAKIKWEG